MMNKPAKSLSKMIRPVLAALMFFGASSAHLAAEGSSAVILGQQSEAQTRELSNRLEDSDFLIFSVAEGDLPNILKTVVDSAQLLIYTTDAAAGRDAISLLTELQASDEPWFGQVAVLIDACTGSALERPVGVDVLVSRGVEPQCEGQADLQALISQAEDEVTLVEIFAGAAVLTGADPFGLSLPSQIAEGAATEIVIPTVAAQQAVFVPSAGDLGAQAENVSFFALPPDAQRAFIPAPSGYPEPSVFVGLRDLDDGSSSPDVPEALSGAGIAYNDVVARNAMRSSDPEGFASLLQAGAFDPPAEEAARAIQTELARMKCYTSTVDGIWGRGSIASVGRYFTAINAAVPTQSATPGLFRSIIAREDIECAVATAARTPRATRAATPRRQTTPTPARTRPATPPPVTPPKPTGSGIKGQTIIGGFR